MTTPNQSAGCTWPEQEIVDAWLQKHGITLPHTVTLELKEDLTKLRAPSTKAAPAQEEKTTPEWLIRAVHDLRDCELGTRFKGDRTMVAMEDERWAKFIFSYIPDGCGPVPSPLTGNEQVLHNGRWVDVITMPNFDANKAYTWRLKPKSRKP